MSSRGHRYAEFQRALKNGNVWVAEAVARELQHVWLEDALKLTHLYAEKEQWAKFERAAMRWLGRYLEEKEPTLKSFAKVVRELEQRQVDEQSREPELAKDLRIEVRGLEAVSAWRSAPFDTGGRPHEFRSWPAAAGPPPLARLLSHRMIAPPVVDWIGARAREASTFRRKRANTMSQRRGSEGTGSLTR